jgi:hypothetical protein
MATLTVMEGAGFAPVRQVSALRAHEHLGKFHDGLRECLHFRIGAVGAKGIVVSADMVANDPQSLQSVDYRGDGRGNPRGGRSGCGILSLIEALHPENLSQVFREAVHKVSQSVMGLARERETALVAPGEKIEKVFEQLARLAGGTLPVERRCGQNSL